MPISGLIGAGANDALLEMLTQQLQQEQLEEMQRRARAQEAMEQTRLGETMRVNTVQERRQQEQDRLAGEDRTLALEDRTRRIAREDLERRRTDNQSGVRRMIGDFLVQRGAPPQAGDRTTLQGMALQEDVSLPKVATEPSPEEEATLREQLRREGFADFKQRADYQEGQLRTRPLKPARTEMTPGQAFTAERQLRGEFARETKAAREVQQQFRLMQSAVDAARQGNLAAGSQGVLVTFQKILDPTSVVRESEYARSAAGQSLLSRIEGAATRLARGGAGVPVAELEKFVQLAEQFARNQAAAAAETKAQLDAVAEEYGLNPARITREIGDVTAPPGGGDLYQQYLKRRGGGTP